MTYPETAPEVGAWNFCEYACSMTRPLVPRSGFQHLRSVRAFVMFTKVRRPLGDVYRLFG